MSRPPAYPVERAAATAFAELLAYPYQRPAGIDLCEALARAESAPAGELVARFRTFAEQATLGELQEAYTMTFDLDTLSQATPTCYPYVGHHLFEESHKRSAFLLGLKGHYAQHGFEESVELPDHLAVMLRFLGLCEDAALAAELVDEALLPALERMVGPEENGEAADGRSAYRGLVRALALVFAAQRPARPEGAAKAGARAEWEREGDSLGIARDRCRH